MHLLILHTDLTTSEIRQLEKVGRKIIRECGNLPLPISAIGGILQQESSSRWWEKLCKTIDSYLQHGTGFEKDERVTQILDLSYKVLPYNLKPCFLYIGCFPEDKEINAEQLYLLWMAEGMVSHKDRVRGETLRNVAERYLCELANRYMVQVEIDEFSISNKFKSCRLHDLMRDLCLSKGKDEEFLEVIDGHMGTEDASLIYKTSRLAIHLDRVEDDYLGKNKKLQSLLLLKVGYRRRVLNNLVSINLRTLKFLKILILEGYNFENKQFPEEIKELILLKHLSIQYSRIEELPSSVCNLPCLQLLNLDVYGRLGMPNTIYKLRRLKHLDLPRLQRVIGGKLKLEGLNELETLNWFNSRIHDTTHLIKLSKLQRLRALIYDDESLRMIVDHILKHQDQFRETRLSIGEGMTLENDSSTLLMKILRINSLSYLGILVRVGKLPAYELELWQSIVTLFLHGCYIEEDPMEILEKLPMLRELTLWPNSYVGREMVCQESGFSKLRNLSLMNFGNLEEWRVEERAMPSLSYLEIWGCEKLKMIPEGLKFITTLKRLKIHEMPEEFKDKARVVDGEEGEDYHKIKHIPFIDISW